MTSFFVFFWYFFQNFPSRSRAFDKGKASPPTKPNYIMGSAYASGEWFEVEASSSSEDEGSWAHVGDDAKLKMLKQNFPSKLAPSQLLVSERVHTSACAVCSYVNPCACMRVHRTS